MLKNPNAMGGSGAPSADAEAWLSLDPDYQTSEQHQEERGMEEVFDRYIGEYEELVRTGKMTKEQADQEMEMILQSTVEDINNIRNEYKAKFQAAAATAQAQHTKNLQQITGAAQAPRKLEGVQLADTGKIFAAQKANIAAQQGQQTEQTEPKEENLAGLPGKQLMDVSAVLKAQAAAGAPLKTALDVAMEKTDPYVHKLGGQDILEDGSVAATLSAEGVEDHSDNYDRHTPPIVTSADKLKTTTEAWKNETGIFSGTEKFEIPGVGEVTVTNMKELAEKGITSKEEIIAHLASIFSGIRAKLEEGGESSTAESPSAEEATRPVQYNEAWEENFDTNEWQRYTADRARGNRGLKNLFKPGRRMQRIKATVFAALATIGLAATLSSNISAQASEDQQTPVYLTELQTEGGGAISQARTAVEQAAAAAAYGSGESTSTGSYEYASLANHPELRALLPDSPTDNFGNYDVAGGYNSAGKFSPASVGNFGPIFEQMGVTDPQPEDYARAYEVLCLNQAPTAAFMATSFGLSGFEGLSYEDATEKIKNMDDAAKTEFTAALDNLFKNADFSFDKVNGSVTSFYIQNQGGDMRGNTFKINVEDETTVKMTLTSDYGATLTAEFLARCANGVKAITATSADGVVFKIDVPTKTPSVPVSSESEIPATIAPAAETPTPETPAPVIVTPQEETPTKDEESEPEQEQQDQEDQEDQKNDENKDKGTKGHKDTKTQQWGKSGDPHTGSDVDISDQVGEGVSEEQNQETTNSNDGFARRETPGQSSDVYVDDADGGDSGFAPIAAEGTTVEGGRLGGGANQGGSQTNGENATAPTNTDQGRAADADASAAMSSAVKQNTDNGGPGGVINNSQPTQSASQSAVNAVEGGEF